MGFFKKVFCNAGALICLASSMNSNSQIAMRTDAESVHQTTKAIRAQDRDLAKTVRNALSMSKELTSSAVIVLARGGNVALVGTVTSDKQIAIASKIASSVPGVKEVENNLILRISGH